MSSDKVYTEKACSEMKQQLEYSNGICTEKDNVIVGFNRQIEKFELAIIELNNENERTQEKETKFLSQIEYLEKEMLSSKKRCQEQAEALAEMAALLETSKLETDDLREMQASLQEAKWTDDKEILGCNQCNRSFSVSRRKHHCRRCGGVYCHDCTSSRMPLASSSKPMRVCDTCHNVLLKNYTSITSLTDTVD